MPARRLFLALALMTPMLAAGLLLPWLAAVGLGLDLALLAAFAIDLRRAGRARVEAERRWPPLLVQGASETLEIEIRSGEARSLTLRLREGLHPALALRPEVSDRVLPAVSRAVWRIALAPSRRGVHRCGPLTARVLGPWGIAWAQMELLPEENHKVYPQVRWEGPVGRLLDLAHRRRLGQMPLRHRGPGTEPYALREYLPGDSVSKIHWKATARHDRLVSREETWEVGARLMILLDCGRGMASMDRGRSKLDHALAASLALARVAVARGDAVSLLAFSDRIERRGRVRSAGRGIAVAYGAFYDLEARLAEPAFDLAAEGALALEARRSTVVLMTSVVDLAAAELLRGALLALGRRHRPLLINLEDPEIAALAHGIPASPSEAFAQAACLEILLANRRLGKHLRRAGIRVVSTPSDRLALETLEGYLAMFGGARRRRTA